MEEARILIGEPATLGGASENTDFPNLELTRKESVGADEGGGPYQESMAVSADCARALSNSKGGVTALDVSVSGSEKQNHDKQEFIW